MGAILPPDQQTAPCAAYGAPLTGQRRGGLLSEDDNENRPDTERYDRFTS